MSVYNWAHFAAASDTQDKDNEGQDQSLSYRLVDQSLSTGNKHLRFPATKRDWAAARLAVLQVLGHIGGGHVVLPLGCIVHLGGAQERLLQERMRLLTNACLEHV